MATVTGTYQDGRVILDNPVDWPNGRRVTISSDEIRIGIIEEEWPRTPEGIEELVRRMETVPALSEEDAADFERALAEVEAWNQKCFELQKQKQPPAAGNGAQPPTSARPPTDPAGSSS
jgi:hypothetical protein